jgi:hypothetical protein
MSAPVARTSRTPGGSVQGTRQQLDELDALLQRMLSLPVNHGEGSPPVGLAPEEEMPAEEEWIPSPTPRTPAIPRLAEPTQPTYAPHQPASRPLPQSPHRSYPASYMVVETATPPYFEQRGEPKDCLGPRMVSAERHQQPTPYSFPPPVPGGRHDLVEDTPIDPIAEVARAQLAMPDEGGEWVPLQSSWQPSAQTWKPLAETWEHSRGSAPPRPTLPEPPMMPTPARVAPEMPAWRDNVIPPAPPGYEEMQRSAFSPPQSARPAAPENTPLPAPVAQVAPAKRTPLVFAPVVWFNKGFDLMLFPLGPLGRWFRGQSGRTVLGTVGLLCLAGAIVFAVVEGFGWTR